MYPSFGRLAFFLKPWRVRPRYVLLFVVSALVASNLVNETHRNVAKLYNTATRASIVIRQHGQETKPSAPERQR